MSVATAKKNEATPVIESESSDSNIAGYLVLGEITLTNEEGVSSIHRPDTVLSRWEVSSYVRKRVDDGVARYRAILEPLSETQVKDHRAKATALEGDHLVEGNRIAPPWEDYVGLHPDEIIQRLHESDDLDLISRVKLYERGGHNRLQIVNYVTPAERPPWHAYDDMKVGEVLDKFDVLSPAAVAEAISYEFTHRKRPAIVSYERDPSPPSPTDGPH